jgi:hypothetical protein
MHWAWSLALPPTPKIVLLALADEANDDGQTFPSVAYLARKCSLGDRTVQRVLRRLTRDRYVSVEHRFRRDRARTSNEYRLMTNGPPSNCHPPPDSGDTGVVTSVAGYRCQPCHWGGVNGDGGTTSTYPCIDPTPQQLPVQRATGSAATSGSADRYRPVLCFPKGISPTQQQALARQLTVLANDDAQQIIDELAGRMNATPVRDPVRYCARLVERFKRGEFRLELGQVVARRRNDRRDATATLTDSPNADRAPSNRAISGLPPRIRDALERMRPGSNSDQNDSDPDAGQTRQGASD